MFGDKLASKDPSPFLVHDWRNDVVTIGEAPAEMVKAATHGQVDRPWPAQLNEKVWSKRLQKGASKSLVVSIGQVVPHEVLGMANYNKNLFVGTGGVEAINLSHFIGAVYGMERMMGTKSNPLRDILNYASERFLEKELDLWYVLTVVAPDENGKLCVRGLYIGRDIQCYSNACDLSLRVNFTLLPKPVSRMVVFLDADEFHSTWLGNKAIYRTRMAMADEGRLIILAPGVSRFGEDERVDQLIRKYGYKGTLTTMKAMEENEELRNNLSAVAHLIHGSSEGRFTVTYCPGHLTREEIEGVSFQYADLSEMSKRYDVAQLKDGWQTDGDGDFFFIRNPALGLWAFESRFEKNR
jgi:nickel-dependent lactate racemase